MRQAKEAGDFESLAKSDLRTLAKTLKANTDGKFFGKTIVFTGQMESMNRKKMTIQAKQYGFETLTVVNKKTDYLVEGIQVAVTVEDGISSKKRRALQLIKEGSSIKILTEAKYLAMVGL